MPKQKGPIKLESTFYGLTYFLDSKPLNHIIYSFPFTNPWTRQPSVNLNGMFYITIFRQCATPFSENPGAFVASQDIISPSLKLPLPTKLSVFHSGGEKEMSI